MKTVLSKFILLVLGPVLLSGCKKDDTNSNNSEQIDFSANLVASYLFDNNFSDNSKSDVALSVNGATLTADRNGNTNKAASFDGNAQDLKIRNAQHLKLQFPFTVALWVNMSNNATFGNRLFNSDTIGYYGYWITCGWPIAGQVSAGFGNGAATPNLAANRISFYSTTTLDSNRWYHICAVFKALDNIEIYIDGVKEETTYDGGATQMVHSQSPAAMGSLETYHYKGKLDNVKIWNAALTPKAVMAEYQLTE